MENIVVNIKKKYINYNNANEYRSKKDIMDDLFLQTSGIMTLFENCIIFGQFLDNLLNQNYEMCNDKKLFVLHHMTHNRYEKIMKKSDDMKCRIINNAIIVNNIVIKIYSFDNVKEYNSIEERLSSSNILLDENFDLYVNPKLLLNCEYNFDPTILNNEQHDELMPFYNNIITNHFDEFKKGVNLLKNISPLLLNVCFALHNIDLFEFLLSKKVGPPKHLIFDLVSENQTQYVSLMLKYHINFDILNDDGLTPYDFSITTIKRSNKSNFIEMIKLMNDVNYVRNPKIIDFIEECDIFQTMRRTDIEEELFAKIGYLCKSEKSTFENVIEMNMHIIEIALKHNAISFIINFLKIHHDFINYHQFYDNLSSLGKTHLMDLIDTYLPLTKDKIIFLLENRMYANIIKVKDILNFDIITQYLINSYDADSLVFILEYIDSKYIERTFDVVTKTGINCKQSILYLLCNLSSNTVKQSIDKINTFINIIVHYKPTIINEQDSNENNLLFVSCHNQYIFDILMKMECQPNIINKLGDNYLHFIVKYGNIAVLNKVVLCGLIERYGLLNKVNNDGNTPIMLALKLKRFDMMEILIREKADVTICDKIGNSVLHYIKLFDIPNNANKTDHQSNTFGQTPNDYALQHILENVKQ
jgi:hypothetical protein